MATVSLIIMVGESNIPGYGQNANLLTEELAASAAVQIFNDDTDAFENLDVGTNNQIDQGSVGPTDPQHGFEVPLLNSVLYGGWDHSPVYLFKKGRPGTTVSQWNAGGANQVAFESDVSDALSLLAGMGHTVRITFWISLGLNDIQQGTVIATFKTDMIDWIGRLRTAVSDASAKVLLTKFEESAERSAMNTALGEIATTVGNAVAIDTLDVGSPTGSYHWNDVQLKVVGQQLIDLSQGWDGVPLIGRLISYWPLNEASGNALDAHGSNDLTETSGTIAAATGHVYATARDFEDGDTEYFTHADNADLRTGEDNWTFAVWFKAESLSGVPVVAWKGVGGGNAEFEWGIAWSSGTLKAFFGNAGTLFATLDLGAISTGTWYLVTVGRDAVNNNFYARLDDDTPVTVFHNGSVNSGDEPFYIGAFPLSSLYWDGLIGPAMFWKRFLPANEANDDLAQIYNAGAGLPYEQFVESSSVGGRLLSGSKLHRLSLVG